MAEGFVGYNVAIKLQDGQSVTGTVAAIDTTGQTLRLSNGASAALWHSICLKVLTAIPQATWAMSSSGVSSERAGARRRAA